MMAGLAANRPPSETLLDESSSSFDLESLFSHPAGLRVAREIARQRIIAHLRSQRISSQPSSTHDSFSTSSSTPLTYDSSPEVAMLLRDILAFSDGEAQTSKEQGMSGFGADIRSGYEQSRAGQDPNPAVSVTDSKLQTRPPTNNHSPRARNSSSSHTQQTHPSSGRRPFSHPSSMLRYPPNPALDIPLSTTPGEVSPYRVESPSGHRTPVDLARSSAQLEAQSFGIRNLETEPDIVRAASSLLGLSSNNTNSSNTKLIRSSSKNSKVGHFSIRPVDTRPAPAIKGFLPVNKELYGKTSKDVSQTVSKTATMQDSPVYPRLSSLAKTTDPTPRPTSYLAEPGPVPVSSNSPLIAPRLIESRAVVNGDVNGESKDAAKAPEKKEKKKRKAKELEKEGEPLAKRPRKGRKKAPPKPKAVKPEPAKSRLPDHIWMRILEFTPPSFLRKARLIDKKFNAIVLGFDSIFINQRKELYGSDMPDRPFGLTERQYNNLLGGKGCMEEGCEDKKTSRTHWSWAKRWCWECWKLKIEREDRVLKLRQNQYGRGTLVKMLECIPIGMYDSFLKPHDYIEDVDSRPRGAPRLYRYYLKDDVQRIVKEYEALTPAPHKDDPEKTPEENALAQTKYNEMVANLEQSRINFFAARKASNDAHMKLVLQIETAVRKRREGNAKPYEKNRQARRDLFLKRAGEDIPHINAEFIKKTKAFRAATRIFRDAGSERGWRALKPKIEKEWDEYQSGDKEKSITQNSTRESTASGDLDNAKAGVINLEATDASSSRLLEDIMEGVEMSMGQLDGADNEPINNREFNNGQRNGLNGQQLGQQITKERWATPNEDLYGGIGGGQPGNMHLNSGLVNRQNHSQNYQANNRSRQNGMLMQDQTLAQQRLQMQMQMFAARARPNMFLPKMRNSMMGVSTNGLNQSGVGSQPSSNNYARSMSGLQYSQGTSAFNNTWNGISPMNFLSEQTPAGSFMNLDYASNSTNSMSSNLAMPRPISQASYPLATSMGIDMPRPLSLPEFNPNQVQISGVMNRLHSQSVSPQPSSKIPVSSLLSATPTPFNPYAQ